MIKHKWQGLFHSELYHGWGKTKKYFEGWYYKIVSKDEQSAYAFIPGVAMDKEGNRQAFIQVLDGKKCEAVYHKFDYDDFIPSEGIHDVSILSNRFQVDHITLDLADIKGTLQFTNQVPWSNSWYSPGIMGPFSFVPFMQCYHGILSMDHSIEGGLTIKGEQVDFTGGRGYMEKDWGSSFPSGYIWMQSNHFSEPGISMKLSVAKIPWLMSSFVGFIAGVWVKDTLIEFTTYNLTKLKKSQANSKYVEVILENNRYRLHVRADRVNATELASPQLGFMDGRIEESMTAELFVNLLDKKHNKVILDDVGNNAGLEVAGKIEEILI